MYVCSNFDNIRLSHPVLRVTFVFFNLTNHVNRNPRGMSCTHTSRD